NHFTIFSIWDGRSGEVLAGEFIGGSPNGPRNFLGPAMVALGFEGLSISGGTFTGGGNNPVFTYGNSARVALGSQSVWNSGGVFQGGPFGKKYSGNEDAVFVSMLRDSGLTITGGEFHDFTNLTNQPRPEANALAVLADSDSSGTISGGQFFGSIHLIIDR